MPNHSRFVGERSLISMGSDLADMAFDASKRIDTILDTAERRVFSLSQQNLRKSFISLKKALAESFDRLDELHKNSDGLRGLATGFLDLDNTLAGMQKSNLLVLAARPGIGKTAFALSIAQHAAVVKGYKVGFFALEMSTEEMVDRLLVYQADIDAWRLKPVVSTRTILRNYPKRGSAAEAPLYLTILPANLF